MGQKRTQEELEIAMHYQLLREEALWQEEARQMQIRQREDYAGATMSQLAAVRAFLAARKAGEEVSPPESIPVALSAFLEFQEDHRFHQLWKEWVRPGRVRGSTLPLNRGEIACRRWIAEGNRILRKLAEDAGVDLDENDPLSIRHPLPDRLRIRESRSH